MQVCNQLKRAIKEAEVLVVAEAAKAIWVESPSRDAVEKVERKATEEGLGLLDTVRTKCKEGLVMKRWVQVVLECLESSSRAQGVETLASLLDMRDELRRLAIHQEARIP
ncbi:unnamed protein product [Nippostrongylus brasiliensis]|uniref:VHS domain-containing protein n=1 Tax=Nippostrongylus brasiliensis TaxID=27835 RepID=A0A0N4YI11_NIPBR|nr:unnamed protein product [Nippostrongylus brasiliensis]